MKTILLVLPLATSLLVAGEPVPVVSSAVPGGTPARFLAEDLDVRIARLRKRLSIISRERGPFGLYQNPAKTPVINHAVKEVSKTPFIEFINGIQISVINSKEKEFLVGARIFRVGQVFPIVRGGERLSVRVEAVRPSRVTFRNLQTGEVALRRLDVLPEGVTAAAGRFRVQGVTSRSRGEAEPLRLETNTPPPAP
ncbi:MAG: hypothetical protein QF706_01450 [Roseibacillus sp.]|jgi:hypothetical protein|nr:hypothetical protein [Roseibacillus sp.]